VGREGVLHVPLALTGDHVVRATVEEAAPPRGGHELTLEIWRSYRDDMRAGDL